MIGADSDTDVVREASADTSSKSSYVPQTILITGASRDLGAAFARRFDDGRTKLVLHARTKEQLEPLLKTIKGPAIGVYFDVSDSAAMARALADLPPAFAEIDLLINNAGGARGLDKFHEGALDDYKTMIDINVTSLVAMTRLILPGMVARKRGHVVNIGSIAGVYPYPGGHVYCGAKSFVEEFSMALRGDLQGTNVRVTIIEPGLVQTGFSLARFKGDQTKADAVYAHTTPLQAHDVAEAVYWAATQPPHVNINRLEIMPTVQAPGPTLIERGKP